METTITAKSNSYISGKLLLVCAILLGLAFCIFNSIPPSVPMDAQMKMEKSTGKNGKHANQKARERAEQEYEKVKAQLQEWRFKPNKTPEDKEFINKLRKLLERLRKKKDFSGENHSQKPKGF